MWELLKIYWKLRLVHYGFFLGFMGGLANLIGPDRNPEIKLAIGITIGCILLGDRLINAVKSLLDCTDKNFNEKS